MAEHSFDLAGEFEAAPNGAATPAVIPPAPETEPAVAAEIQVVEGEQLPRVDPARGVFITSRGDEIQLSDKPVSALYLERIAQQGKPKIPLIEVVLMGKHRQLEAHPHDEGYLALLDEWKSESNIRTLKYLFTVGVKGTPPQEFIDDQQTFFPGASDMDLKYLWICSRVPDEDIDPLTEAIMGGSLPTTKGVEQVANFTESP